LVRSGLPGVIRYSPGLIFNGLHGIFQQVDQNLLQHLLIPRQGEVSRHHRPGYRDVFLQQVFVKKPRYIPEKLFNPDLRKAGFGRIGQVPVGLHKITQPCTSFPDRLEAFFQVADYLPALGVPGQELLFISRNPLQQVPETRFSRLPDMMRMGLIEFMISWRSTRISFCQASTSL